MRFKVLGPLQVTIGNGLLWDAMIRYIEEGPESLDAILAELEAGWPSDG